MPATNEIPETTKLEAITCRGSLRDVKVSFLYGGELLELTMNLKHKRNSVPTTSDGKVVSNTAIRELCNVASAYAVLRRRNLVGDVLEVADN